MRFVVAIVLFVVAFVGIGLGIAQRTVLAGPDHVTVETTTSGTAPVTVIDGSILNALPGTQTIDASGSETVFLAYGRTADVLAWVGDASYNLLEWDTEAQTLGSSVQAGLEATVPAPSGSDLWVQEFSGVEELTRKINVPADASILIVGDGETPAPSSISITWPLDNSAPWSGPLIVGGGLALLAGLAAFVWALLHARRARGPRRKQPKLPKPPKPPQLRPAKQRKAIEAAPPRGRRRLFAASGVAVVTALALGGCTFSGTPELFPVETPTASPTPGAAGTEDLPAPAVTRPQLERIMERIETTVAEADAEGDEDLAETRLAGPALELRAANYEILSSDSSQTAVPVLPQGPVEVILPQQIDTWPRTVFAVVKDENATVAPVAVMLIQETPRDNYKAHYVISLGPSTTLPDMAATAIGAPRVGTDVALGVLQPSELADAYGDILLNGDESEYAVFFDAETDTLREQIGAEYKESVKTSLPATAKVTFSNVAGDEDPIAFGTNDAGLLVAVELVEVEKVTPVEAGAAINPRDRVKALIGLSQTTKGVEARYGVQLLFYVPPVAEEGALIQLLGYSQGLISATEVD